MPRYRALAPLTVNIANAVPGARRVDVGEEFESNDAPGRNWEPMDDDAEEAYRLKWRQKSSHKRQRLMWRASKSVTGPMTPGTVGIAGYWRGEGE